VFLQGTAWGRYEKDSILTMFDFTRLRTWSVGICSKTNGLELVNF
jgi:hypothetical protein